MEKLIEMLDYYVRACKNNSDRNIREKFYDQAFGATEMYMRLNGEDEQKVCDMWMATYRPQFIELVYGV